MVEPKIIPQEVDLEEHACVGCWFSIKGYDCSLIACQPDERKDGKQVRFILENSYEYENQL